MFGTLYIFFNKIVSIKGRDVKSGGPPFNSPIRKFIIIKQLSKNIEHTVVCKRNSNLFLVRSFHTMKKL
jgi:hypothetical protein